MVMLRMSIRMSMRVRVLVGMPVSLKMRIRVRMRVAYVSTFDIPCADVGVADFLMGRPSVTPATWFIAYVSCVCRMGRAIQEKNALQNLQ